MKNTDYLLFVLITSFTLYVLVKWTNLFSKKRYPPGPWGLPIVGHIPLLGTNPELTCIKWWQQYGDVVRIRLGSWNAIVVNGFEAIKDAADRKDDAFSGRPHFVSADAAKEAFEGFEAANQSDFSLKFLQLRKLFVTALRRYTCHCENSPDDIYREEAVILADKLLKYSQSEPVSIESDIELAVGSMSYQMMYGKGTASDIEAHVKEILEAQAVINRFFAAGNITDVVPWLRYIMKGKMEQLKTILLSCDWIRKVKIAEHSNSFETGRMRDFSDVLLAMSRDLPEDENESSISKQSLLIQLVVVQGAGLDPTSRAIQFFILYMAAYPAVQERVQKEVDDVLGCNKNVTWKDRDNLPYLYATILEVLRKVSINTFSLPHNTLHDTKLRGYDVNKGTVVLFNFLSVANEKSYWGDPEIFRPERLLNEDGQLDREKCSHILAFGAGRRRCIGEMIAKLNIFITTTTLMQRCTFKKASGSELDLEPVRSLISSPKPFKVIVQKRY